MWRKYFSAAECSAGSVGKRIGLRSLPSAPSLCKAHGQTSQEMFQRIDIWAIGALGHSVPAGEDATSTPWAIPRSSNELLPVQPVTAETFQEQQDRSYNSTPTRTRPLPRRQQQELLWGAPPSAEQPAHPQGDEPVNVPAGVLPRRSPQPSCPQHQQQQELLGIIQPGADVFAPSQQRQPAGESADGEPMSEEEGHVGPEDLLAQRDEVLLARISRHRNRQIVGSMPPQAPVIPSCVVAAGNPPSLQNDAEIAPVQPLVQAGAHSTLLQPQEADAGTSSMAAESAGATAHSEDVGNGHGGGSSGPRGVALRLRRHGFSDTATPRRIRLPLLERPKPWPVKVLLEALQLEQQGQGQQPQQEHGEGDEQLEQSLGAEEGWPLVPGPRAATPPSTLQVEAGKSGQKQSGQKQQKKREGFSFGPQGMSEKDGAAGFAHRDGKGLHGPGSHGEERLERHGGKQDPQVQGKSIVQERRTAQMQSERQEAQQQGKEKQQRRQQRRRHQQKHQQQQAQQEQRDLAHSQQGQASMQGGEASHIGQMVDPDASRVVAAHPDGTLWSYCSRDVGPLATRVLQMLLKHRRRKEEDKAEGEEGAGEAVMPLQRGEQKGGNESYGASGGLAGADSNAANSSDPEISSGTCHILAAGSHQTYNLLRALSYAQGALRLAAFNGPAGSASDLTANTAGPVLAFTAGDVSLSDLRMYFEQTVQHGTGPRPELGPPLPPRPLRKKDDAAVGAHGLTASQKGMVSRDERGDGAAEPAGPQRWQPASISTGGNREQPAQGTSAILDANTAPGQMPPSAPRQGWPGDVEQLEPRALVTAFLVRPPLDLAYGAAIVPAAAGGGLPPLAVSTAADVDTLSRLLAARLRRHGYCCMQALGRGAASRTLEILSAASGSLCRAGLGVLAFPRMGPLGPQPRAVIPLPRGTSAAAMATSPPAIGRDEGRRSAGWTPAAAETTAATATAAIAAVLDPVLLDKAPQLVLEVVPCGWDEYGLPVVSEGLGPPMPVRAGGAAAAAAAPTSAGGPSHTESREGVTLQHGAERRGYARWALQSVSAARSGGSSGYVSADGSPPVRLMAPASTTCCELRLGGPDGGPDTRVAADFVARNAAEGRRVVLTARGLGSLLRLPVVMFRAQGMLRELERPLRRVLVFTLHTPDTDSAAKTREESPRGPQGGTQPQPMRQPQLQLMEQLEMQRHQRQRRRQKQQHASVTLGSLEPSEGSVDAGRGGRQLRATSGDDSLAAEVSRVPASALQHHLDSLPAFPPGYINARSAKRRLLPYAGGDECEDNVKGGDSTSSADQQNVEAAAAAAAEHLIQYGIATLVGTSPGSRITALLAAACVSESFMRSAGLTVLVRVNPQARPLEPASTLTRQRGNNNVEMASTGPPPPPNCYQLLLSRMDPRVGRLQLLRPNDLTVAGPGTVDRSST